MAVMAVCSHQANRRFGARKSGSAGTPAGAQGLRVLRGDANSCAFFSRLELVLDFMAQAFHGFCPWRVLRLNKHGARKFPAANVGAMGASCERIWSRLASSRAPVHSPSMPPTSAHST